MNTFSDSVATALDLLISFDPQLWVIVGRSLAVSATDIRERRAAGLGIDHLVPAPVARYIDLHHLYLPA